MKISGDRNQCAGCGEYFNSSFSFDKHRAGEHTDNGRYCLTPEQMRAKGMDKNAAGFWISAAMPETALPSTTQE